MTWASALPILITVAIQFTLTVLGFWLSARSGLSPQQARLQDIAKDTVDIIESQSHALRETVNELRSEKDVYEQRIKALSDEALSAQARYDAVLSDKDAQIDLVRAELREAMHKNAAARLLMAPQVSTTEGHAIGADAHMAPQGGA